MESDPRIDTEAEWLHAEAAIEEGRRTGHTDKRCLRDGGRFVYEDRGSAYIIRCENGDFEVVARGL